MFTLKRIFLLFYFVFSNVKLLCPMDREVIDVNTVSKKYYINV